MNLDKITGPLQSEFKELILSLYCYEDGVSLSGASEQTGLLFIVKQSPTAQLELIRKLLEPVAKDGLRALKIFTLAELTDSLDVFPIEFLEMQSGAKLVFGTDVLAELTVSDENLRHELEFYLRSYLLKLREGAILGNGSKTDLIKRSFPRVLQLLKLIATSKHTLSDQQASTLIKETEAQLKVQLNGFKSVLDKFEAKDLEPYFETYLSSLESLISQVDHAIN